MPRAVRGHFGTDTPRTGTPPSGNGMESAPGGSTLHEIRLPAAPRGNSRQLVSRSG
jgi:hypothetical protein